MALAYRERYLPTREAMANTPPVKGAGLIIVDKQGEHILVVEEHQPKTITERARGQISIPLETAKTRRLGLGQERREHTILGAFTEIADDASLTHLQQRLQQVTMQGRTTVTLSPSISAQLAVFVYDGDVTENMWTPTAEQETAAPRWIRLQDFLTSENIRPFARTAVTYAQEQGFLDADTLGNTQRRSVLTRITSLEAFSRRREQRQDVSLT